MTRENQECLQDFYIRTMVEQQSYMAIHLINGKRLEGTIREFDQYTLLLELNKCTQLVFKHAIATVLPAKERYMDKS